MAFRRRRAAVPSITERLGETFDQREIRIGTFLGAEVDLVQVWGRTGLVRVPQTAHAAGDGNESVEAITRRLEEAGYLRPGPPRPDEPPRDQVPATVGPDREPVTLLGDFAIVCALRSRPGVVIEARWHDSEGDGACRLYMGVMPNVMLQEVSLDQGRLGFVLYKAERGLIWLAGICGVQLEDLDRTATEPRRSQMPAREARPRWNQWTELRFARPAEAEVALTTLLVGRDSDGLWVVEPPNDAAEAAIAEWIDPNAFGERLTDLIRPTAGTESWLPSTVDGP